VDGFSRPRGGALDEITTAQAVDECLAFWGPDLFAYLLGAGVDRPLAEWQLDAALVTDEIVRARLWAVHDLARLFENPPAARAWVRARNPELGGYRPADVLRLGPPDDLLRVRELAERELRKVDRPIGG
jgi:Protein of unknown function (DUF2384)